MKVPLAPREIGDTTNANNKGWLVKRIDWRLQAVAEGGLSDRSRLRAAELANDADLRLTPPKVKAPPPPATPQTRTADLPVAGDNRLPPPGTLLTRVYKGRALQVKVLPHGFEFVGDLHKSLSAVAKAITGQHCNGFLFFRLNKEPAR